MKKLGTITIVHLIIMMILSVGTIGAAVHFFVDFMKTDGMARFSNLSNIVLMATIFAMLVTGILYLLKHYSKQAAGFYKAFLIIHIAVCALTIFVDLSFYTVNAFMAAISVLNGCKIVVLALLAFWKNLGRDRTWTLFYILLALDAVKLVLAAANMAGIGFDFSFTGYVTALIADGTIGLAVKGKYQDKDARGTV